MSAECPEFGGRKLDETTPGNLTLHVVSRMKGTLQCLVEKLMQRVAAGVLLESLGVGESSREPSEPSLLHDQASGLFP